MAERADKFENCYIGVRGCWFNVSDVLVWSFTTHYLGKFRQNIMTARLQWTTAVDATRIHHAAATDQWRI